MVLQQQAVNRFWGDATTNAMVKVSPSWTKDVYTTKATAQGKWMLSFKHPRPVGRIR